MLLHLSLGRSQIDLDVDGDADFCTEWSPLSEHGLADLRDLLDEGYKSVIIDTFSRILGCSDQMGQQEMTLTSAPHPTCPKSHPRLRLLSRNRVRRTLQLVRRTFPPRLRRFYQLLPSLPLRDGPIQSVA